MKKFTFSSVLDKRYRRDLEKLLFFNFSGPKARAKIIEAVRKYGSPKIVKSGPNLKVELNGLPEVQSLFVFCDEKGAMPHLCGAVVYVRESPESILVLHIAVHREFTMRGAHPGEWLLYKMIDQLREIARVVKGIRFISILYAPENRRLIPIRPPVPG